MKILFVDMDGVIVDFIQSAKNSPDYEKYIDELDKIPDIFLNAPPMKYAIDSISKIIDSGKYDIYIASTAPWDNIASLSHKRIWIEKYFGNTNQIKNMALKKKYNLYLLKNKIFKIK